MSILNDYVAELFAPRKLKNPYEWVKDNCTLRDNVTELPGAVKLFPYAVEPANNIINPHVNKQTLCWGSQSSKTLTFTASMAYLLAEFPKDAIWIMPSADNARNFSKGRWLPFMEDCKRLREQCPISAASGRIDTDKITNMRQEFLSCTLTFAGAGSENNVKSAPVAYLVMDEIDEIDEDIRQAALERIKGRREYKIIQTSTPTTEDGGVWREYLNGDQRKYYVPCPHCEEFILLEWRQQEKKRYSIKFDESAKLDDGTWDYNKVARTAHFQCPCCDGKIMDAHKPQMLEGGEWRATNPHAPEGHRSYHLSSLYSPVMQFSTLMVKWLQAQGSISALKKFIQGDLAEPWRDELVNTDQADANQLEADYERGTIKGEVRLLQVDTQTDHFRFTVRGYEQSGDSYLIDYGMAPNFTDLDALFDKYSCHRACIDTRGDRTAEIYEEVWRRRGKWIGIQGYDRMQEPYRIQQKDPFTGDKQGRGGRSKIMILQVNKSVWEPELVALRAAKLKGFYTFADTPKDYYDQLFGAYWVEKKDSSGHKKLVRKVRKCGDHYLDCEVYGRAFSKFLGLGRVDAAPIKVASSEEQPKQRRKKKSNRPAGGGFW